MSVFQSEYFHELSVEPVISTCIPHKGLDSGGGQSISVDLHCTVNGLDRVRANFHTRLTFTRCYRARPFLVACAKYVVLAMRKGLLA